MRVYNIFVQIKNHVPTGDVCPLSFINRHNIMKIIFNRWLHLCRSKGVSFFLFVCGVLHWVTA